MSGDKLRVLTDLPGYASHTWNDSVEQVHLPDIGSRLCKKFLPGKALTFLRRLCRAIYLLRLSRKYDFAVTVGFAHGTIFGILQYLFVNRRNAIPIIYLDCLYYSYKNPVKTVLKSLELRLAARPYNRFVCWSRRETINYSRHFGIQPSHFVFIPYYNTLLNEDMCCTEGDYIFSGGNSDRDYPTLIKAVKSLPTRVKVIIATQTKDWVTPDIEAMPNVEIGPLPYAMYSQSMKDCLINVIMLRKGMLRSAGQQTFINSVMLGKSTVICDNGESLDYFESGKDVYQVPSGDVDRLKDVLQKLLESRRLRQSLSVNGKAAAKRFNHEKTMSAVLELGERLARGLKVSTDLPKSQKRGML